MRANGLTVLIVDDEPLVRRGIRTVLSNAEDVTVVVEAGDGRSAVEMIVAHRPDLVFLDIQMPEMDGFDVLTAIPDDLCPTVVFVTAYDEYALRAFDVCALDYLLKPFDDDRLLTALARARERIADSDSAANLATVLQELKSTSRASRIAVRTGDRIVYLSIDDIEWCEAADNYVRIHAEGKRYLIRDTIGRLERWLNPDRFVRVHRSAIVNVYRVKELRPHASGDGDIVLSNDTIVKLSRNYRSRFEAKLTGM